MRQTSGLSLKFLSGENRSSLKQIRKKLGWCYSVIIVTKTNNVIVLLLLLSLPPSLFSPTAEAQSFPTQPDTALIIQTENRFFWGPFKHTNAATNNHLNVFIADHFHNKMIILSKICQKRVKPTQQNFPRIDLTSCFFLSSS